MDEIPEKYRRDLEIIRATADQILRDLKVDDFKLELSGNEFLAFSEFTTQLMPIIENYYKNDRNGFLALLYRIDVNEKDYRKAIAESTPQNLAEKLSELIIRREFQKVLTLKYFSGKI